MTIKDMLKRVRASQPLKHLTTSALKGLFNATGRPSEFVIKHLPRTGVTKPRPYLMTRVATAHARL
jgi:hypothetical protein